MKKTKQTPEQRAQLEGYRSGLETVTAKHLNGLGVPFKYEEHLVRYEKPARPSRYTPDFVLENGIVIETKGRFVTADRQKHILIKNQHPDLDVRFVFSRSKDKISKTSKTTYAAWCEHKGFLYADKQIPIEWILEEPQQARLSAIEKAGLI